MPKKQTIERVRRDKREGKSASTQAGEFVREEIEEIRAGKHGARSTKQAIRHRAFQTSPGRSEIGAAEAGQDFGGHSAQGAARSGKG